ncbi:hypothetical protein MJM45_31155, partial [Salmonella enterica subsp. enterica serovar Kentucky]|nr:hypothetical protein [Salmonella enterica subsp. enterica serovar Kentucky]
WWSNSNQEIQGITGVERSLSAMIDDPQSEVNQLNENGITTIFLDPLSLSLNLEANLIIHDRTFNQTLRDNLQGIIVNDCKQVDE